MAAEWAKVEMSEADLNDERLNERLVEILSALGERPTASIPAACGGSAEMTAAYRFFDNDKVTHERVLAPHVARTMERIAGQQTVLLIQDTTELDLTRPQQQMEGAGFMGDATSRGAFLHLLFALTPNGTPLGACWTHVWTRDHIGEETPTEKKKRRKATPFEEKESVRWVEGLQQARAVAERAPATRCVCLADSEADIYELFLEPRGERPVEWIVRACQERLLQKGPNSDDEVGNVRVAVEDQPVLSTQEIAVRGRLPSKITCNTHGRQQPRESRTAQVEVRAVTVTLRGPQRPGGHLQPTTVNVVQVREVHAPAGDVPVEWLLFTTLPIDTVEQVLEIVQYYRVRFLIEVLFRILKSGCRVEERRFEHIDRLLPCLAIYLIVAWRTFLVCRLGRSSPELSCETIFDPAEWKSVWMAVTRQQPPSVPPPLTKLVPLVAQLGGYIPRPNRKDPPGPQTVWLGLQRMYDLALAWNTFGPGATNTRQRAKTCV